MAAGGRTPRGQNIQRGNMNEKDKKAIQENIILIEREVDGKDLASFLFTKEAIDWNEYTQIKGQGTPKGRTQTVLEIIFTRGPRAYSIFLAALHHEGYEHVADAIIRTRAGQSNVSIGNDIGAAGKVVTSDRHRLDIVEGDVEKVKDDVQGMKGGVQKLKGDVQGMKGDVQKIDRRVERLENDEVKVEKMEKEIQKLRMQEENSKSQINNLKDQLKKKDQAIEALQRDNEDKSDRIVILEEERDRVKEKLKEQEKVNRRLEDEIKNSKDEIERVKADAKRDRAEMRNEWKSTKKEMEQHLMQQMESMFKAQQGKADSPTVSRSTPLSKKVSPATTGNTEEGLSEDTKKCEQVFYANVKGNEIERVRADAKKDKAEMEQKLEAKEQQFEARDQQFEERMRRMEQRFEQQAQQSERNNRTNNRKNPRKNNVTKRNKKH